MRAAQITAYGGSEVMRVSDQVPKPKIGDDQVLVEVRAAGINPFDWKVQTGMVQQMAQLTFPATLGGDFAGIVVETGDGVDSVQVGNEVFGQANALSGQGSFAEFTVVKAESVALKPKSVDFVTAAALPLAGVSAYQALVEHINLKAGQKILVHGGAGGIGSLAIQIAKHLGAFVATTVGESAFALVKDLGADNVIDYKSHDFSEELKDFDAVFDTVGGETYKKSFKILTKGGIIVSMIEQPDQQLIDQYGVMAIAQFTRISQEKLTKLAELVDHGVLKVVIDKVFPLSETADALDYLKSGRHKGKVVIKIH